MSGPENKEKGPQSHDWCPPGFWAIPLEDEKASDLLWLYSRRVKRSDPLLSERLEEALQKVGFDPSDQKFHR